MLLKLLHVVSLRKVGGIQRDYARFISTPVVEPAVTHHTLLTRPGIAAPIRADIRIASASIATLRHVGRLRIPDWAIWWQRARFSRLLARIRPDAIVLWSTPRALARLPLPADVSLVYYEHGAIWFDRSYSEIREQVTRFDGIVCNSRASARMLALRWPLGDTPPVRVCANAVERPADGSGPPRELPEGTVVLGIAGRLEPVKGFALAIQALGHLVAAGRDVTLRVAGSGSERAALESLVAALGLTARVRFLGFVEDMASFYRGIDLFLCPSLREAFGLVAAEAMAHGLPVLCTAVDGLPEVVENDVDGICLTPTLALENYRTLGGRLDGLPLKVYDPASDSLMPPRLVDPSRLANAVEALLDDPARLRRLSKNALARTALRPDYGAHVAEVIATIAELAGRGNGVCRH